MEAIRSVFLRTFGILFGLCSTTSDAQMTTPSETDRKLEKIERSNAPKEKCSSEKGDYGKSV